MNSKQEISTFENVLDSDHRRLRRSIYQKVISKKLHGNQKPTTLIELKKSWMLRNIINQFLFLTPLNYRKQMKFKQEWQKQQENQSSYIQQGQKNNKHLFRQTQRSYLIIQTLLLVFCCLFLLVVSIAQVYEVQKKTFASMYYVWIICIIVDILLNINTVKIIQNEQIFDRKIIIVNYLKNELIYELICIIYIFLTIYVSASFIPSLIFSMPVSIALTIKIIKKYAHFKELILDLQINRQFKIAQIFIFMLIMAHIFGLLMYLASYYNSKKNWLIKYEIDHLTWSSKYIFSIYWAITTMVTVGYGDITPANQLEVCVTMIVEIFGTAIFGYMINIIGITLTQIKKQDENLEEDQRIIFRLSKCFNLSKDLTYRLRKYIEDNNKADQSYSFQDQKLLRSKLNSQLNNEIMNQTNIKVIKKSVFFLTYFTRNFQNQISQKLIKKIYHPEQFLEQQLNLLSTYLIEKGKVEIYYKKTNNKKVVYKPMREINSSQDNVNFNVYGYTKMISGREMDLQAKSKSFIVAYELKRKHFLQILQSNPIDYETTCQLRDMILQKYPHEMIQGKCLKDYKSHYFLNKYLAIKRSTHNLSNKRLKKTRLQQRQRIKSLIFKNEIYNENEDTITSIESFDVKNTLFYYNFPAANNACKKQEEEKQKKVCKKIINETEKQVKQEFVFEVLKIFDNYYKYCNLDRVLEKYKIRQSKKQEKTITESED